MVRRNTPWTSLLLTALLAVVPRAAAQDAVPEVRWRSDYAQARQEAQDRGLPLVIDFGTKECFWCRKLDDTTFRDRRVVGAMNERFIPLKVDAHRDPQLTQALRIASFPTIVLASSDGRILGTVEGYQEAGVFHENLQRVLASLTPPDWMQRDLQNASKWAGAGEYARAIPTLRTIVEDGKARPVQATAAKLLKEIEDKGAERVARARKQQEGGQVPEAIETISETMRLFPGSQASKDAADLLTRLVQNADIRSQQRTRRARELLTQAKDFYKSKDYLLCLDRCEALLAHYGDMAEGQEATQLAQEIKNNPEWLQGAADTLTERLGSVYLALAESLLKRGQPQRAEVYLQRVVQAFPGSRQAESAQARLSQINGNAPRPSGIQSAGP